MTNELGGYRGYMAIILAGVETDFSFLKSGITFPCGLAGGPVVVLPSLVAIADSLFTLNSNKLIFILKVLIVKTVTALPIT